VQVHRGSVVRDQQLGRTLAASQCEAYVARALILGVLDDLLKSASRLAVDLLGEPLAALDHLTEDPWQVQELKCLDCALSGLSIEGCLVTVSFDQQALD
jgi:hypothetical protein